MVFPVDRRIDFKMTPVRKRSEERIDRYDYESISRLTLMTLDIN